VNANPTRLLLVANPDAMHVGAHFLEAAGALGIDAHLCDVRRASSGPRLFQKAAWWAAGHRPLRLRRFSREVVEAARRLRPQYVLTTGLAPLDAAALDALGRLGVVRLNFLTDDPWNPAHHAPWFLEALGRYDVVFSPRRATLADIERGGGPRARYLPFAYAPSQHFIDRPTDAESATWDADVVFAGGGDPDRVEIFDALIRAGLRVALYGGYWDRYAQTRGAARGHVGPGGVRKAIGGGRVALCLVRRANRDSHSMRTFEVPAMGGCVLAEDTVDHRDLFGAEGEAALYFRTPDDAVDRVRALLKAAADRARMSSRSHAIITAGRHRYADRLDQMLSEVKRAS